MLQPGGLQRMVEPAKKKKMPNVQFKTAWKFPETGGKSRKKAEKNRQFAEICGKSRKNKDILEFGTKRPRVSEPNVSTVCCPPQAEKRRTNQSKRAMRPLQGSSAKIEIAFRIPPANFIVATLRNLSRRSWLC